MSSNTLNLTRRRFLATAAAASAAGYAAPLFAQANPFEAVPPLPGLPAPDAPLRWLDSGDQKGVFFREYLSHYGQARGIETVYDGLPWTELDTVLPLAIRNGTAPDSFQLPTTVTPAVAVGEGWVRPLDDLIPDIAQWKAAFPEGTFVEGLTDFGGKTYAFPYSSARLASTWLLFNRELLGEAGYDNIGPDRALTFDELRDAAAKITANSNGRVAGIIFGGAQVGRWGLITLSLAHRAGAQVGNEGLVQGLDFHTGEYAFASDPVVEAVELLLALRDDGSVFPGSLSINAPQARALVPQGAAGLIIQGPWNVPIWEEQHPEFDFGISPTPTPEGLDNPLYITQLGANSQWVYANARNPEHVGDFIRWVGSLEGQTHYANIAGAADPAIFPEASRAADLSARSQDALRLAEDKVRLAPNPVVRNGQITEVARVFVEPTPNLAQTVQGLFAGELTDVRASLQTLQDARERALDAAIAEARSGGAEVGREDFVFSNWDPLTDYTAAQYAAL